MFVTLIGIFATLLAALAMMVTIWKFSLKDGDASIVDIWWGPGFIVIAATAMIAAPELTGHDLLVTSLVALWGLRLGWHMMVRHSTLGEDYRYRLMREANQANFPSWSLRNIFLIQAFVMWIISLPVQMSIIWSTQYTPGMLTWLGIAMFAVGFVFETLADFQLSRHRFIPENRDRVLDKGLWALSRHPNYFGETLLWWGIYIVCVAAVPQIWWTIAGPVLLTVLLLKVTGVAMLENVARVAQTDAYRDYQKRTSTFFPLPPARDAAAPDDALRQSQTKSPEPKELRG